MRIYFTCNIEVSVGLYGLSPHLLACMTGALNQVRWMGHFARSARRAWIVTCGVLFPSPSFAKKLAWLVKCMSIIVQRTDFVKFYRPIGLTKPTEKLPSFSSNFTWNLPEGRNKSQLKSVLAILTIANRISLDIALAMTKEGEITFWLVKNILVKNILARSDLSESNLKIPAWDPCLITWHRY